MTEIVEITIRDCEVTVLVVTFLVTMMTLSIAIKNIIKIYKDMHNGKYIQWDIHHSQQHFAIFWICALISIAMFVSTFELEHIQHTFVEHLAFNLLCVFVIFPHLTSE